MAFYAVGTQAGKEQDVAEDLAANKSPHIHAVLAPSRLESYVIVEADGEGPVERAVAETPFAVKMLDGQTSPQEALSFISPGSSVEDVVEGDVVEITGGPYEGQRARVQSINTADEAVTVELHEETIPIPISVSGDQIRVLNSAQYE